MRAAVHSRSTYSIERVLALTQDEGRNEKFP